MSHTNGTRNGHGKNTITGPAPLADAVWLNCAEIEANPYQPRRTFDEAEMQSLIDDIREHGAVDSPVTVRPIECDERLTPLQIRNKQARGIHYQIVFGERRWRATQEAGFPRIPARIRKLSDIKSAERALKENTERAQLSDLDEARAMLSYWDAWATDEKRAISQNEMIRRFGKRVMNLRKLLETCEVADDLKPIAETFPGVMTQVFAIHETRGELRQELVKLFDVKKKRRASVNDVNNFITNWKANQREVRESYTPPDAHTQTRLIQATIAGSAPQSRGMAMKSHSARESTQAAQEAANSAASNLETVRQWVERGGTVPKASLMEARRRIDALLGLK
jgi:ParB/RepB/Spo0J family partition protein